MVQAKLEQLSSLLIYFHARSNLLAIIQLYPVGNKSTAYLTTFRTRLPRERDIHFLILDFRFIWNRRICISLRSYHEFSHLGDKTSSRSFGKSATWLRYVYGKCRANSLFRPIDVQRRETFARDKQHRL